MVWGRERPFHTPSGFSSRERGRARLMACLTKPGAPEMLTLHGKRGLERYRFFGQAENLVQMAMF